jgi:predicted Rossmann fold flavoprotein
VKTYDLIIVGGGAAGYFAGIHAKESNRNASVLILEGSNKTLSKVRISGGGRCNVTNAIWKPKELVEHYPRGKEFLLNPFKKFHSKDTQAWFENRGVKLKTEDDGRVFPITNKSESIVYCLEEEARKLGVVIQTNRRIHQIAKKKYWELEGNEHQYVTKKLAVCTGSNAKIWDQLGALGHSIISPVPSLFTFNIQHPIFEDNSGISFEFASVRIQEKNLKAAGPLLITHWGLSGPAVLKLSAWGARDLHELDYTFKAEVDFLSNVPYEKLQTEILKFAAENPKKQVSSQALFGLPKRFWKQLCAFSEIPEYRNYSEFGKNQRKSLLKNLKSLKVEVKGKSTFKEEFVTAGGVSMDEINPIDFSSKLHKNLFLAGEVLNIDAITGGFNFQAAWTGGYLIGSQIKL